MYTIYAGNINFSGIRNTLKFTSGVATSDNNDLIQWFESHGYKVVVEAGIQVEEVKTPPVTKRKTTKKGSV